MATVNKDFRVKHGLVVEGTNATVDGSDIITEDALVGGTQTNVTVTYDAENKVVNFVAESGLADGDTDDLAEGTTNLYFTDQRALDATASAYDLAGAAAQALADAEDYADGLAANYDAAGSAATAESNANSYTDGEITTALSTAQGYADDAESSANSYTDGEVETALTTSQGYVDTHSDLTTGVHGVSGDVVGTSDAQTLTNKTMGDDLLMDGNQVSGLGTPTQADHAATKSYVDNTATGIVAKPQVLGATSANIDATYQNGTNGVGATLTFNSNGVFPAEAAGATGWTVGKGILVKNQTNKAQNGRYVIEDMGSESTPYVLRRCSLCDEASEIPGAYTFVQDGTLEGTGWIQVVSDPATFVVGTDDIDVYQFSGEGTYTAGNGLELNGTTFSIDETITATRTFASEEAADALQDAKDYADALDTDDISEGSTNQYYTTVRAKTDAAALITGATKTNITITGDENGLTITAENGVADSDTDDLSEGSTNLYFTDTRAVDALEAVVPNFTAIEVNSIAKQVAAITYAATEDVPVVAFAFAKADYRSAKFLVKVAYSTHTEVSEVLLTLDTSDNIAITEFAVVSTNGSASGISAGISGSNVQLLVTPNNNGSTVTVFGTLLSEDLLLS